jgi:hypothetical protein
MSSKGEQQVAAVSVFCGSRVPTKVRSVPSKMAFASLVCTTKVTKVTRSASCGGSFFVRKQRLHFHEEIGNEGSSSHSLPTNMISFKKIHAETRLVPMLGAWP